MMDNKEIAKQIRELAEDRDIGQQVWCELRFLADRLDSEATQATSALSGYPSTCRGCGKNLKVGTRAFYVLLCSECDATLEAKPTSPTLASLLTPDMAKKLMEDICPSDHETCGMDSQGCLYAKFCDALAQRAKEGK
jgi:hypothetical protein